MKNHQALNGGIPLRREDRTAAISLFKQGEKRRVEKEKQRYTGVVKWYNPQKRFGFIVPADASVNGGGEIFVHVSALKAAGIDILNADDRIAFAVENFRQKIQAIDLVKL